MLTFLLALISFILIVSLLGGAKFNSLNLKSLQAESVTVSGFMSAKTGISTAGIVNASNVIAAHTVSGMKVQAQDIKSANTLSAATVTANNIAATKTVYGMNVVFGNGKNGYVYSNNGKNSTLFFGSIASAIAAGHTWPGITDSDSKK